MSLSFTFTTIFEILLVAAVFWGIFNEDKLISFENRLISAIRRRRLRVLKSTPSNTYSSRAYLYNSEN